MTPGKQVASRKTMPHLMFVPSGTPPAGGWPLLVFLHGQGGEFSDAAASRRYPGPAADLRTCARHDENGRVVSAEAHVVAIL